MELVEVIARTIATEHFNRKQHYGVGTKEARVAYLVNEYWIQYIPDAKAVIKVIDLYFDKHYTETGWH